MHRAPRRIRQSRIRQLALDFADQTTLHGLKEFTQPDNPNLKLGWLILIILCMCFMVMGVIFVITSYFDQKTASRVQHTTPDHFPAVLFCPKDWVDPNNREKYKIDEDLYKFISILSWTNFEWWNGWPEIQHLNLTLMREQYRQLKIDNNFESVYDVYKMIAYNADSVIVPDTRDSCNIDTSPANKPTLVVRSTGVCYRVIFTRSNTMGESMTTNCIVYNLTSTKPAIPDNSSFGSFLTADRMELSAADSGPEIIKDNKTYKLYPPYFPGSLPHHKVYLGPDAYSKYSENDYPVRQNYSFIFKVRASKHSFPEEGEKWTKQGTGVCKDHISVEQQLDCMLKCRKAWVAELQKCSFFFGEEKFKDDDLCLMKDDIVNISQVWTDKTEAYYKDSSAKIAECYAKECPQPCKKWIYEPVVLSLGLMDVLGDIGVLQFKFQNFFSTISIEEYETYQWQSFLGNVGGMVSLWTGASFLSICHIFYHFVLRQICPRPESIRKFRRSINGGVSMVATMSTDRLASLGHKFRRSARHPSVSTVSDQMYLPKPQVSMEDDIYDKPMSVRKAGDRRNMRAANPSDGESSDVEKMYIEPIDAVMRQRTSELLRSTEAQSRSRRVLPREAVLQYPNTSQHRPSKTKARKASEWQRRRTPPKVFRRWSSNEILPSNGPSIDQSISNGPSMDKSMNNGPSISNGPLISNGPISNGPPVPPAHSLPANEVSTSKSHNLMPVVMSRKRSYIHPSQIGDFGCINGGESNGILQSSEEVRFSDDGRQAKTTIMDNDK